MWGAPVASIVSFISFCLLGPHQSTRIVLNKYYLRTLPGNVRVLFGCMVFAQCIHPFFFFFLTASQKLWKCQMPEPQRSDSDVVLLCLSIYEDASKSSYENGIKKQTYLNTK